MQRAAVADAERAQRRRGVRAELSPAEDEALGGRGHARGLDQELLELGDGRLLFVVGKGEE